MVLSVNEYIYTEQLILINNYQYNEKKNSQTSNIVSLFQPHRKALSNFLWSATDLLHAQTLLALAK